MSLLSTAFYRRIAYHDYEGPSLDLAERERLLADLGDRRAMILRNLRPAFRAAIDSRLHPEVLEKMPPPPDDRDDIAFTPIYCDLVPR